MGSEMCIRDSLAITPTFSPWTHTSDDSYIYQLSLVLATAAVSLVVMRRDLNTCNSQSAMHHGVPVRVFLRQSSEHHSRNNSSSSTSWSHDSHVFSHSRTLVVPGTFLRVLYNIIHHHVAFARELEEKEKKTPSRTNQQ